MDLYTSLKHLKKESINTYLLSVLVRQSSREWALLRGQRAYGLVGETVTMPWKCGQLLQSLQ